MLFDASISDLHACLKLVPLALFRRLALRESRFGPDTELTATLLRLGVRPFEVPISYYSRSHAEGKKINWRDAFACVAILFKVRLRRRKRLFAHDSAPDAASRHNQESLAGASYEFTPALTTSSQPYGDVGCPD